MLEALVVGAGPAGLMLAGELTLAGVDVLVVERRPTAELVGSRAGGFHSRTTEILDQRGLADRFLAEGKTYPVASFGHAMLDMSDLPTRHPYTLALTQNHIERILAGWIDELGVPVLRGRVATGFDQDETGVDLHLGTGETIRGSYLVGADGGRSVIRMTAGIGFPGWEPSMSALIAEVEVTEELPTGPTYDADGIHGLSVMEDGRTVRVVTSEPVVAQTQEPTLSDLSANLVSVFGTDFGVHNPTWISRFTDSTRQASVYRDRRILLVGDAAHVHSPAGGQGVGLGVQDAVNLGWKLARVIRGTSPHSLLDTYQAERHPAGARTLQYTMAASTLQRQDARIGAVRDLVSQLTGFEAARDYVAGIVSGLDVSYDLGDGHPLLGRRMPDLDLMIDSVATRVYVLLHTARPLVVDLGAPGSLDIGLWADDVHLVNASYDGAWELPLIGDVPAPEAVMIRPDGHVAWVGEGTDVGLTDALTTWFGSRQ